MVEDSQGGAVRRSMRADGLVDVYLRERQARHELTAPSAKNHRSALRRFASVVGDTPVRQLDREDVERWLESRDRVSAATRRHELSMVRSFCGWLVRRGHLRFDPTTEMPIVREPRRQPRAQAPDRVARLLAKTPDVRGRLMCLLMVQEGLRCAEVSGLQIGDVDFVERQALIVGKGGHERLLPISEETWSALDEYLAEHPATSGPLIRSYKREWRALSPDHISGLVGRWMSDAGLKRWARDGVSAHALRHSCATDMLRGGAHVRDVQRALGHAHLATTEIYLPLIVDDLREAMGGRRYRGSDQAEISRPGVRA